MTQDPGADPGAGRRPDPEETAPIATPWSTPSGADPTVPVPPPPTTAYPTETPSYQPPPVTGPTYTEHGEPAQQPPAAYQPSYQQGYQQGFSPLPAYGYQPQPYLYAGQSHGSATTAMWLGITGVVGALLTPFCCITLPLLVCSPIAWWLGASSRRAIDTNPPGTYGNRGQAQAGMVLGIIGSILGVLAILGVVLLFGLVFAGS